MRSQLGQCENENVNALWFYMIRGNIKYVLITYLKTNSFANFQILHLIPIFFIIAMNEEYSFIGVEVIDNY